MKRLKNIYRLGIKELISLRYDAVLIFLIIYCFTVLVYLEALSGGMELSNASVAITDEDQSQLSNRISDSLLKPYFLPPQRLSINDIDKAMDAGLFTFVIDIPPDFQADLVRRRNPDIQVNVDATAMSQAGIGAGYISKILTDEITEYLQGRAEYRHPVKMAVRVKFNPNLQSIWFMGVMAIINVLTMLAMLITGAAIIREREHGTIDHLLVMPLKPFEIMSAKIWANGLVIVIVTLLSLFMIVNLLLKVPLKGSISLFILGTILYLFATTSIGIFLATVARSMPQLGLLTVLVIFPMLAMSGGYTPLSSMPKIIQKLMMLSPTTHFVSFAQAVLFRGAGIDIVWREFAVESVIGVVFFVSALFRFRKTITISQS